MDTFALTDTQREQIEQWLFSRPDDDGRDLLNALSYNPRRIIQLRYGLADGHHYSVEEIADIFAKSVHWVVEVEAGALSQLYQFLAPAGKLCV